MNLYAYCNNDPVNYADPSGHFAVSLAIAGLIVGAVIGATIGGITAYNAAKVNGSEGWELFGWTALGILGGGALGGAVGYGIGYYWPSIASFLGGSFSFTLPSLGTINMGGALALAGGVTVTVTGAQIVGGVMAAGIGASLMAYESKKVAPRIRSNTKKQAYDKAFQKGGKKEPIYHPNGKYGPHFHPANFKFKHWHYYFSFLLGVLGIDLEEN